MTSMRLPGRSVQISISIENRACYPFCCPRLGISIVTSVLCKLFPSIYTSICLLLLMGSFKCWSSNWLMTIQCDIGCHMAEASIPICNAWLAESCGSKVTPIFSSAFIHGWPSMVEQSSHLTTTNQWRMTFIHFMVALNNSSWFILVGDQPRPLEWDG